MSSVSANASSKPRLIVLTDITSTQSGVREPDDSQSMIRLMLYADKFDIEGLIASSGLQHGHVVRPQNIRKIVDAYAKVRPNLVLHDPHYPSADRLRQVIKSGQPMADRGMPLYKSIGERKDTPASQWIIHVVDKSDSRPVWILSWGGTADLAQALWKVRRTRSHQALQKFLSKIRVAASGDQDSTGPWIKSQFPDLFYATRTEGGRGMYRGGDHSLVSSAWVRQNIKGHGALGDIYPIYNGGDNWSHQIGKVKGIKGGDSSSFMGLIPNGLNVRGHLTWENWGGRLKRVGDSNHYHGAIDPVGHYKRDISPYLAAVYRWRPAFQADYAARFDWCVKPYHQANHVPVNSGGNGVINKNVAAGERVQLASGDWSDPDGNDLRFHWQVLKQESSYSHNIRIGNQSSRTAEFTAPDVKHRQSIHLLLTVTDDGHQALSSYKRFTITVQPRSNDTGDQSEGDGGDGGPRHPVGMSLSTNPQQVHVGDTFKLQAMLVYSDGSRHPVSSHRIPHTFNRHILKQVGGHIWNTTFKAIGAGTTTLKDSNAGQTGRIRVSVQSGSGGTADQSGEPGGSGESSSGGGGGNGDSSGPRHLVGMALSTTPQQVHVGDTFKLQAMLVYSDGSRHPVSTHRIPHTFNHNVLKQVGGHIWNTTFKAIGAGTTTLKDSNAGQMGRIRVSVQSGSGGTADQSGEPDGGGGNSGSSGPRHLVGMALATNPQQVHVGDTFQLLAKLVYSDGSRRPVSTHRVPSSFNRHILKQVGGHVWNTTFKAVNVGTTSLLDSNSGVHSRIRVTVRP